MFKASLARSHARAIIAIAAISGCALILGTPTAQAKTHGSFVPGLSIVPNLFQPDGKTLRTYETSEGLAYWSPDLPIKPGDKLALKVFATTGGAELDKLIVRVDNVKIAEVTTAPWSAMLDTSTLAQGSHSVEVWAEAGGNPSKAATKTLTFLVAAPPAPETVEKGSAAIEADEPMGAAGDPTPSFLAGRDTDTNASVSIRAQDPEVDRLLTTDGGSILISAPILLSCERSPGSEAVKYAYALTRNGKSVIASTKPESMEYVKIKLQPRGDDKVGLLPGQVTLWVWGIDQAGHPSNPTHRDFTIGSAGQQ